MYDPKALLPIFQDAAAGLPIDFTHRAMFGGILVYADSKPLASLSNVGLALKLSAKRQEELLAIAGAKRLQYEPDSPPSKTYILVPPSFLEAESAALRTWIARALGLPEVPLRSAS